MRRRHGGAKAGTANWARPFLRGARCARKSRPGSYGKATWATNRCPGRPARAPADRGHGRHHAGHRIRTRTRSPGGATAQADPPPGRTPATRRRWREQPGSSMPCRGPPPGRHRAPDPDADALTRRCDGPGPDPPPGAHLRRPAGGGGAAGIVHAVQRPPPGRHRAPDPDADALTRRCDGPGGPAPGVHSSGPQAVAERPGPSMPYGGPPPGRHRAPDRTRTRSPGGATARANPPPGCTPAPRGRWRSSRDRPCRPSVRAPAAVGALTRWAPETVPSVATSRALRAAAQPRRRRRGTLCGMEPWSVRSGSPAASTGRPRTPRAPVRR